MHSERLKVSVRTPATAGVGSGSAVRPRRHLPMTFAEIQVAARERGPRVRERRPDQPDKTGRPTLTTECVLNQYPVLGLGTPGRSDASRRRTLQVPVATPSEFSATTDGWSISHGWATARRTMMVCTVSVVDQDLDVRTLPEAPIDFNTTQ